MRILMTSDTYGGVWTHTRTLAPELARRGHAVVLAALGRAPTSDERRELAAAGVVLEHRPWRLEWMPEPWADLAKTRAWLVELASLHRPDVAHLCTFGDGAVPWTVPTLVVAHSEVRGWWRAVHGCPAPAEWDRYARLVRASLRAAEVVAAPTRAMLADLEREYGALATTRVVPNGRAAPAGSRRRKRAFVLAAGRLWDEAKNLAALRRVASDVPWPILVAGATAGPDGEERATAGLVALGELAPDALRRWMERASLYVLPARYEPFGQSALEAALAGCALVLGDIPSLREVWGDAAVYVAPDDHAALAAEIRRLARDGEERQRLARRARRRARAFTPERMAGGYESVYAELVAADRSPVLPLARPGARRLA